MMQNKIRLMLLKKNFILLNNNHLIYNQSLLNLKKKSVKFTESSLFYWVMLVYMKRLGLLKKK